MNLPSVAVIIPAHNEERFITSTIASICAQNYPREKVEIIVVDNNSSDDTSLLAEKAGAKAVVCSSNRVGAVRNFGVALSQSELLCFIDGDCEAGPLWLRAAADKLMDPKIGAVGGSCLLPQKTTWVERAFVGPNGRLNGEVACLAGSSFIIRRADFEAIGRFSETLSAGEDDELSARVRSAGLKVIALPDCAVIHNGYPTSLNGIFRKQLWHARNQLEAAESWLDPTLVITHLFLLSVCGALVTTIFPLFHSAIFSIISLLMALTLAGLLAAVKTFRTGGGVKRLIPLTAINIVYLSARSIALIGNYLRKLTKTA